MKFGKNVKIIAVLFLVTMLLGAFISGCNGNERGKTDDPNQQAEADWVPEQINVVVAHKVGSNMDILTRTFCQLWSEKLGGTNFTFDNKDAASGRVAYDFFQTLPKDGTSILSSNVCNAAIMYAQQKPGWDWMETLDPMGTMVVDPGIFMTDKNSKFDSFEQLIEEGKKSKPIAAISRWESEETLLLQQIMELTGAQFEIIPFGGAAEVMAAIFGGHADFTPGKVSTFQKNEDGLKVLAVSAEENLVPELTHNAKTVSDTLGTDTMTVSSYRTFLVHTEFKNSHPERYKKLVETFEETKKDPRYVEEAVKQGFHPDLIVEFSPDEVNKVIEQSWAAYEKYKDFYSQK